jgi:Protein of unknown function (DUF4230)
VKEDNIQPSTPSARRPRRGAFSWPVALTLIALTIAAVVVIIFLRLERWPVHTAHESVDELERLGKDLRSAFVDIAHLQPRIIINNHVYLEQTTPTTELSILSRRMEVEHEFQSTWAGSSKRVKLHGTFLVKAGFNLRQSFAVDLHPDEITVRLPHAQILGIEQQQVDVLAFENGFWNRISADDVQNELSILPQLARQKALETNLPTEAERALQQQLEARLHPSQPLHLIFKTPAKEE